MLVVCKTKLHLLLFFLHSWSFLFTFGSWKKKSTMLSFFFIYLFFLEKCTFFFSIYCQWLYNYHLHYHDLWSFIILVISVAFILVLIIIIIILPSSLRLYISQNYAFLSVNIYFPVVWLGSSCLRVGRLHYLSVIIIAIVL